ncbi:helix-turn-helix transcriptional regulator [Horticoccus luteus]|uniref:Helix-turn-helix transcriptional regulator n=1 Tax=Horticoccus luteus TaxID=2862869 RepID=A0A8F9XL82_9BACT|nr:helix-turn-helix transcriptional regulator [Horticoccus luteus]QYM78774.1 helix-turn-helix transcriptional regulator [Horticoccus luteus]
MAPATSPSASPSTSAGPARHGDPLRRVHAALTLPELWLALRTLSHDLLPARALTFSVGCNDDGRPRKIYRHAHPPTPRELRQADPQYPWLAAHPGAAVYRLSDFDAEFTPSATFRERVMRRAGWDHLLGLAAWSGRVLHGTFNVHRATADGDFSSREIALARDLQPAFETALTRVLAHEQTGFLAGHFAAMLEDVPVGLLLLDWDLRPLWFNGEAAHACSVWNHGERRAAALNPRRSFRVPSPLADACAAVRAEWEQRNGAPVEPGHHPVVISEHPLGLHAQIALCALPASPLLPPAFHVQLDYRRPRGDRHRPLSPGAVALLARLSAREREVAMRVREGLRTVEIAHELTRSPLTIKTQLAAIFAKLNVRGRSRVAALLNR